MLSIMNIFRNVAVSYFLSAFMFFFYLNYIIIMISDSGKQMSLIKLIIINLKLPEIARIGRIYYYEEINRCLYLSMFAASTISISSS